MKNLKKVYFILENDHRLKVMWLAAITFVIIFLELVGLGLIFPIVSIITDPLSINNFISKYAFLNFLNQLDSRQLLYLMLLSTIVFYFIKNLFIVFLNYARAKISYSLIASISTLMFKGYLNQPLGFSSQKNSAYITRNIIDYAGGFVNHVISPLYVVLFELIFIFSSFYFFLKINFEIGLAILFAISFVIIFYYFANKKRLQNYGKSLNERYAERLKVTKESIEGIKEIHLSNKKNFFLNIFNQHNYRIASITALLEVKQITPRYLLESISVFFIMGSIYFLMESGLQVNEIIPIVAFVAAGLVKITPSVSKIMSSFQRYQSQDHVINLLFQEISKFRKITLNKDNDFLFKKQIKFKNVFFQYNDQDNILKKVNFTIKKNSIFGIKGKSGSGKTTCLNLIIGFLNPKNGTILVDGLDIQENVGNWQKIISYMPQKIFLLDGTLKENICFGLKENEINYENLQQSLQYAQIEDFADPQRGGLSRLLGERGSKISAGQTQRVGLARALYGKPQLLILDESTSALDEKTEKKILQDIIKLKKNITIILVSHSDKVLSFCDTIYNLDENNS
jgi:ABC-type bacteriocin/lantibiotic exporter with double-glycine peptidase domain